MNLVFASLLSVILWCSPIWCLPATADAGGALSETVRVSLSNGNAHQLSVYFSQTLQLVIDPVNVEFQSVQAAQAGESRKKREPTRPVRRTGKPRAHGRDRQARGSAHRGDGAARADGFRESGRLGLWLHDERLLQCSLAADGDTRHSHAFNSNQNETNSHVKSLLGQHLPRRQ